MVEQGSELARKHLRSSGQLDNLDKWKVEPPANPGPLPIARTRREVLGTSALGIGGGVVFVVSAKSRGEQNTLLNQQAAAAYPPTRSSSDVSMANDLFTSLVNAAQTGDVHTIQIANNGNSLDAAALVVAEEIDKKNKISAFKSEHQGFRFWRDTIGIATGATGAIISSLSLLASAFYHVGTFRLRIRSTREDPQSNPQA